MLIVFATRLTETRLQQSENREHAAGFSFFGTIRIIKIDMAGGADAAVVNLFHAFAATLLDNFRREIDFIMRRANAGAQLNDEIRTI